MKPSFENVECNPSHCMERDLLFIWPLESLQELFIEFRRNLKLRMRYRVVHVLTRISLIKILSINHRKFLYGGTLS